MNFIAFYRRRFALAISGVAEGDNPPRAESLLEEAFFDRVITCYIYPLLRIATNNLYFFIY